MTKKIERTAKGLRDALFDEIDSLRGEDADPPRSMAIANMAKQIISIARAEMDFQARMNQDEQLCDDFMTGSLKLGGNAKSANEPKLLNGSGAASAESDAMER